MATPLYVFHSPHINAYYNLALEEHLLRSRQKDRILLLWRSANTVVIGRHQNLPEEINLPYAEEKGIAVVRRSSGGGAVYQDTGNVNFSFIAPRRQSGEEAMRFFTQPVIAALEDLGIEASLSGRNDIMIDYKKISGNAQMVLGNAMLHHGTLLYHVDIAKLAGVLKVRPEKFASKSIKSVRSRVGNITDFLTNPPAVEVFINHLLWHIGKAEDAQPLVLSAQDNTDIEALLLGKYKTWEWNHGRSPKSTMKKTQWFSGGMLEIYLEINDGRMAECVFYGDFMSMRPAEEVATALSGTPFTRQNAEAVLEVFFNTTPIEEYFGTITLPELLDCFFSD